jgi:uncharacterized protein YaiI (UPF0178 family)
MRMITVSALWDALDGDIMKNLKGKDIFITRFDLVCE